MQKRPSFKIPVEPHLTAAWANITWVEPDSCVAIPSEFEVENAKEWVDENQK
ncbi:MAG TPA: DUF3787 domain-containing protein [Verrucomicrobiae bacterium]|nr:DUF3787 domain-containing protein [Verrucomicrobiae bacterium]